MPLEPLVLTPHLPFGMAHAAQPMPWPMPRERLESGLCHSGLLAPSPSTELVLDTQQVFQGSLLLDRVSMRKCLSHPTFSTPIKERGQSTPCPRSGETGQEGGWQEGVLPAGRAGTGLGAGLGVSPGRLPGRGRVAQSRAGQGEQSSRRF